MADSTDEDSEDTDEDRNWLTWMLIGLLVVAVVVLTFMLLRDDPEPPPAETPSPTQSEAEPEPEPEAEPEPEPTEAMPLLGPEESRLIDGASKPASETSLEDGDYFGILHGIDTVKWTVDVDFAVLYTGQAAIDWLDANDPDAENPPPNGYVIVNEVERVQPVPVDADAPVWVWCHPDDDEDFPFVELTVAQWAAAPVGGDQACSAGTSIGRDPADLYWFDVRGEVVLQVVGQYVP